ncbi:hypothetical protein [Shinella sumterensis]|jgi:hypothetical protein|uniref:Uncharacterized protein n=1 Tax=Shinella sumterensis TaxID=1967501 RepID=A0AA50CSB5_9HYPH|nr:hypothetical protein [Shinella sumterensis]WLS01139.1 hypothetical protein Q9313_27560 [Shinella sumterensis]
MSAVKAFLIEPMAGTIRPVTINLKSSYSDIKRLLKCQMIDIVRVSGFDIIVDDNGLNKAVECLTNVEGAPHPLAGNLLVTKSDRLGELVDVSEAIEDVATLFSIIRLEHHPELVAGDGSATGDLILRIKIRLDHIPLKVVNAANA